MRQAGNTNMVSGSGDAQTHIIIPGNSLLGALPFPIVLSDGKRFIVLQGDLYSTQCGSDCPCYRYSGLRGEGILSVDSAGDGYHIRINPEFAGQ